MNRVLACDLDGIIFDFNTPYINWLNTNFKCQIPPTSDNYPDTWYYATDGGHVTKEQDGEFWKWCAGIGNYSFWRFLPTYEGSKYFLEDAFHVFDDVWFITSRPGKDAKRATEDALKMLGVNQPQVVISSYKVPDLIGVGATDFLDDRDKNFDDVLDWGTEEGSIHLKGSLPKGYIEGVNAEMSPTLDINLWMLDRPWNRHYKREGVKRIFHRPAIFNG